MYYSNITSATRTLCYKINPGVRDSILHIIVIPVQTTYLIGAAVLVGMWFTGLWGLIFALSRFTGSRVDMKISYQVTKYRTYMYNVLLYNVRSRCTNTISRYIFDKMHLIAM